MFGCLIVFLPVSSSRPPIFVAIFQVGGAITVLGQHLVNLKCMFPGYTDADVFYSTQLTWGVAPPIVLLLCVVTWQVMDKIMPCFEISDLQINIKSSCVALLYLLWPALCSQTFSMFACRSVCDDNTFFLRADLDEICWSGRHSMYVLVLGLPMLFLYVVGLPVLAYLRVYAMTRKLSIHRKSLGNDSENKKEVGLEILKHDHKIYGMFYSSFRNETWWWEATVAARKIVIALIGVFGAEMKNMQVHLTAMLVVLILLVTAQVRPFGGLSNGLLHVLEMASLMATFLTLWAGSVFNTLPRCEDPLKGEGTTLAWCDALSIVVGLVDILVVIAFVGCFIYLKVGSQNEIEEQVVLNPMVEHGRAVAGGGGETSAPENLAKNSGIRTVEMVDIKVSD